jgi:hypothetical protein
VEAASSMIRFIVVSTSCAAPAMEGSAETSGNRCEGGTMPIIVLPRSS